MYLTSENDVFLVFVEHIVELFSFRKTDEILHYLELTQKKKSILSKEFVCYWKKVWERM